MLRFMRRGLTNFKQCIAYSQSHQKMIQRPIKYLSVLGLCLGSATIYKLNYNDSELSSLTPIQIVHAASQSNLQQTSLKSLGENIFPGIVQITQHSGCSLGFVVDSQHVITSRQLLNYEEPVVVHLYNGPECKGTIVAVDNVKELGLIKLEGSQPVKPLSFGNVSSHPTGSPIVAVLDRGSLCLGIISSHRPAGQYFPLDPQLSYLQCDIQLPHYATTVGSIFVSEEGQVLALNGCCPRHKRGVFGLTADHAQTFYKDYLKRRKSASGHRLPLRMDTDFAVSEPHTSQELAAIRLSGLQLLSFTEELRREMVSCYSDLGQLLTGVLVLSTVERQGSPQCSLQAGDIIIAMEGKPIANVADLYDSLSECYPKSCPVQVAFTVLRMDLKELGGAVTVQPAQMECLL